MEPPWTARGNFVLVPPVLLLRLLLPLFGGTDRAENSFFFIYNFPCAARARTSVVSTRQSARTTVFTIKKNRRRRRRPPVRRRGGDGPMASGVARGKKRPWRAQCFFYNRYPSATAVAACAFCCRRSRRRSATTAAAAAAPRWCRRNKRKCRLESIRRNFGTAGKRKTPRRLPDAADRIRDCSKCSNLTSIVICCYTQISRVRPESRRDSIKQWKTEAISNFCIFVSLASKNPRNLAAESMKNSSILRCGNRFKNALRLLFVLNFVPVVVALNASGRAPKVGNAFKLTEKIDNIPSTNRTSRYGVRFALDNLFTAITLDEFW